MRDRAEERRAAFAEGEARGLARADERLFARSELQGRIRMAQILLDMPEISYADFDSQTPEDLQALLEDLLVQARAKYHRS